MEESCLNNDVKWLNVWRGTTRSGTRAQAAPTPTPSNPPLRASSTSWRVLHTQQNSIPSHFSPDPRYAGHRPRDQGCTVVAYPIYTQATPASSTARSWRLTSNPEQAGGSKSPALARNLAVVAFHASRNPLETHRSSVYRDAHRSMRPGSYSLPSQSTDIRIPARGHRDGGILAKRYRRRGTRRGLARIEEEKTARQEPRQATATRDPFTCCTRERERSRRSCPSRPRPLHQ